MVSRVSLSSLKINRNDFVDALSVWLRWRGHTLPHDLFSQRFPLMAEQAEYRAMQKAAHSIGLGLHFAKVSKTPLKPESFPRIALLQDGSARAIRFIDSQGQLVASLTGGNAVVVPAEDIVAWVQVSITPRLLHQEILGTAGSGRGWLWGAFTEHWWAYLQGAAAAGIVNLLAIVSSLYAMQVYDRVLPSDSGNTLMVLTIGVLMVYALDFMLRTIRAYVLDYAGKKVDLALSEKVFNQGIGVRMEARPQHTGTFIAQLREHESIREFLLSTTVFALSDLPFLFIFLFAIWLIGGALVYVPLAIIPLVLLVGGLLQLPLMRLAREHIRESNARAGLLIESIEGAETLKTLNAEWRMRRRWRELTELVSGTSLRMKSLSNLSANFASTAQSVMYVGVIAMGALMVREGTLTAGGLMACSILSSRAIAPISQLIGLLTRIYHVRASAQLLDRIMALPVDRPSNASFLAIERHDGRMSLSNVEFCYGDSDVVALHISQLSIGAGERVAILGRTGSGKSTLLRLLSGLYMPTKGRILMDDVDIHQVDPSRFRQTVGYMTQDVRLFAGTLKENLLLGAGVVSDDDLLAAARITGIDRYASTHPKGFDLPIFEGGGGLSGGQKQAVGLARLMLANPSVFLLDEPTASMDQQTEREFIERFAVWLDSGRSLIVATHKPPILALVNRIIVLDQGRVVMDGARDEVLQRLSGAVPAAA